MSASAGPTSQPYSVRQIRDLFRAVAAYVDANPDLMKKEGVFRISATAGELPTIAAEILDGKPLDASHDIHAYIGVLKLAIGRQVLMSDNASIQRLGSALNAVSMDHPETIVASEKAIHQFIQELNQSEDQNKYDLAEILHTYLHLNTIAQQYAAENKMNATNLAIASTGPFFINNLPLASSNPSMMISQMAKFNTAATAAIDSHQYAASYAIAFVDENVDVRRKQMEAIAHQAQEVEHVFERQRGMIEHHATLILADQQKLKVFSEMLASHNAQLKQKKIKKDEYVKITGPVKEQMVKLEREIGHLEKINADLIGILKREQKLREKLQDRLQDIDTAIKTWERSRTPSATTSREVSPEGSPLTPRSSASTSVESSPRSSRELRSSSSSNSESAAPLHRSASVILSKSPATASHHTSLASHTEKMQENNKHRKHRKPGSSAID
jgi:hypothetical protein